MYKSAVGALSSKPLLGCISGCLSLHHFLDRLYGPQIDEDKRRLSNIARAVEGKDPSSLAWLQRKTHFFVQADC